MTKIEEFLRHYSDQRLANLQAAAEDGRLAYRDSCNCLLHHFEGNYSATVSALVSPNTQLAREAEFEFMSMGMGMITPVAEAIRRERILPLIYAEWARRAQPLPVILETPALATVDA